MSFAQLCFHCLWPHATSTISDACGKNYFLIKLELWQRKDGLWQQQANKQINKQNTIRVLHNNYIIVEKAFETGLNISYIAQVLFHPNVPQVVTNHND